MCHLSKSMLLASLCDAIRQPAGIWEKNKGVYECVIVGH